MKLFWNLFKVVVHVEREKNRKESDISAVPATGRSEVFFFVICTENSCFEK